MKKTVKVVMLPTKKASLCKDSSGKLFYYPKDNWFSKDFETDPQYLYFVSDEKIKEGDWYYCSSANCIFKNEGDNKLAWIIDEKKVIATSDKSLSEKTCDRCDGNGRYIEKVLSTRPQRIMSGYTYCSKCSERGVLNNLPQIPESFIKAYVEANGEIDEVMVEYDNPSPWTEKEIKDWNIKAKLELKTTVSNEVIISLPEEKMYNKDEITDIVFNSMSNILDEVSKEYHGDLYEYAVNYVKGNL